jgi:pimeloyl-ACP methyl ester carboxylesterase
MRPQDRDVAVLLATHPVLPSRQQLGIVSEQRRTNGVKLGGRCQTLIHLLSDLSRTTTSELPSWPGDMCARRSHPPHGRQADGSDDKAIQAASDRSRPDQGQAAPLPRRPQYVDALCSDCCLLMIDARAHGGRGKPRDEAAYTWTAWSARSWRSSMMPAPARSHYLGYPVGGRVGYSLGLHAPERLRSAVIGGGSHRPQPGALERGICRVRGHDRVSVARGASWRVGPAG